MSCARVGPALEGMRHGEYKFFCWPGLDIAERRAQSAYGFVVFRTSLTGDTLFRWGSHRVWRVIGLDQRVWGLTLSELEEAERRADFRTMVTSHIGDVEDVRSAASLLRLHMSGDEEGYRASRGAENVFTLSLEVYDVRGYLERQMGNPN